MRGRVPGSFYVLRSVNIAQLAQAEAIPSWWIHIAIHSHYRTCGGHFKRLPNLDIHLKVSNGAPVFWSWKKTNKQPQVKWVVIIAVTVLQNIKGKYVDCLPSAAQYSPGWLDMGGWNAISLATGPAMSKSIFIFKSHSETTPVLKKCYIVQKLAQIMR